MKILKYFLAFAALTFALSSCEKDRSEDAFPTDPVAPELDAHANILMTENTMDEDVVFSWKTARFVGDDVSYIFYAKYEGASYELAKTKSLFFSMSKTAFKSKLYEGFATLPENSTFSMQFYVVADNSTDTYISEELSVTIYAYGDFVSAEVSDDTPMELILDPERGKDDITILKWEAARLGFNETVTYNVYASYTAPASVSTRADAEPKLTTVKEGLTTTSLVMTVDDFNEIMLTAGMPEEATNSVSLIVKAYSETLTEGLESTPFQVSVKTYLASFPAYIYLPGSHQGYNTGTAPRIPMSTMQKGYYEGFVDLTTTGDTKTAFKVCLMDGWDGNLGSSDMVEATDGSGNSTVAGTLEMGGMDNNISVPNGFYRISINKKEGTIHLLKITRVGMIGDATPTEWGGDTEMIYDATSNTYSLALAMISGKEYKFRFNNNWDYSIGVEPNNGNFKFEKPSGTYLFVLDVNSRPYKVDIYPAVNPFYLNVTGDATITSRIYPYGDGYYDGIVKIGSAVSVTAPAQVGSAWTDKVWYLTSGVYDADNTITNYVLAESGDATATTAGWARVSADITNKTAAIFPITRIGLIGGFNNWGAPDTELTYDAVANAWIAKGVVFAESGEYKIRFNDDWKLDVAGDVNDLTYKGGNLMMSKAGTYDFVLKVSKHPFTLSYTKSK